jgi:hypothetical protein
MLERISRAEAWELLAAQTGDYVPAVLDDGLWYASSSRGLLGCILPDDNWRFVILKLDERFRYQRVANGEGYENVQGAERSMQNRAATLLAEPPAGPASQGGYTCGP